MSCSEECVEVNNGNRGLTIGKIFRLDNIHAGDITWSIHYMREPMH